MASNGRLLALMLQSDDPYVLQIYMVAAILALLVGLAGIFMIAGSLNSSTARRTEFFGMMRCLGATRKQVSRLVKREALGWCFRAVPAGIGLGCAVIWILCAVLRILSPGIFEGMPLFGISWIGIVCGGAGGFLTVLLAARSPAKKASQVTPQAAVSGNAGTVWQAKRAVRAGRTLRVETALGVHHALGSKKNFLLMVLSFSFSILLFLAFSAVVDFLGFAIVPLQPYAPDIMVVIAMIAVFNIINSMAMSVSARTQQYGVMRAVGMSRKQLGRMIASEAWTYGIWGILTGCAVGIPLNRFAFTLLVTDRWGEPWELPVCELAIIVLVVAASVAVSAAGPVRKLAGMSIVKNVNTE